MNGRKRRLSVGLGIVLAALFGSAGTASAADYFASPTGSGMACTDPSPCNIYQADMLAAPGDTVKLKPGSHTLAGGHPAGTLFVDSTIEPAAAGTRPEIASTDGTGITMSAAGARLEDLRIDVSRPVPPDPLAVHFQFGGTGERLEIVAGGTAAASGALVKEGAVLSDSTVWVESDFGRAVMAGNGGGTVRNVTAIATGTNSHGFIASGSFGTPQTTAVQNSILRGADEDILAEGGGMVGDVVVNVQNSNYADFDDVGPFAAINELGGQETVNPFYLDPPNGDFHQISFSASTIDQGAAVAGLSATDLDGQPRTNGALPDIGADEIHIPGTPVLTATSPPSPANDNNPELIGSSDPALLNILKDPACAVLPVAGLGTDDTLASPGITVSVPDNSTTSFYAIASLGPGYVSGCSAGLAYQELTPPPLIVQPPAPFPSSSAPTAMPKKCKKGRKLRRGKCVRKKRKKR